MSNNETQIKNAKVLLIGLGGTGSRVVNNVLKDLQDRNITYRSDDVCCAVLDTNQNDVDDIIDSGTNIPVVETSKNQKIRDYVAELNHLKPLSWFPNYDALFEESMIDGASQMRMKSRMGFLGTENDGKVKELESMINNILNIVGDTKIRVMIVSSLSGGTGSGMFIQTALWIRNYFDSRDIAITIKGIFLLPDVFVDTLDSIRKNKLHTLRHYANAYAAIRELNTITKLKTGKPFTTDVERVAIDGLFDSVDNNGAHKPVFDFAFFIDSVTKSGSSLKDLGAYERMTAQLVYMQLFAPMVTDINSQEDNTYLGFIDSEEPLYGSCGTAKAVYPVDDIVQYCALKASGEALKNGWSKIDDEIAAIQREEAQRELDGEYGRPKIDPRAKYIQLFDEKIAKTGKEIGKFRLFTIIARDICNETFAPDSDGKIRSTPTDKVGDFCGDFEKKKIDAMVQSKMGTKKNSFLLTEKWGKTEHTIESLQKDVKTKANALATNMRYFEDNVRSYADEIVSSIIPLDMGDVNADNEISIYGMMTKKNVEGERFFVHPLAVRYMLYKLEDELLKRKTGEKKIADLRTAAINGYGEGEEQISFDNGATSHKESTPSEYLDSKKGRQRANRFCAYFTKQYVQFNKSQSALFERYMRALLKDMVIEDLLPRIKELSKSVEKFFATLGDVSKMVKNEIDVNIEKNEDTSEKILYICADRFEKAAIYDSLNIDVSKSNTAINKSVYDSVYGKFCFENRPSSDDNIPYGEYNVAETFLLNIVNAFGKDIVEDYGERIDLDIYQALCLEADINSVSAGKDDKKFELRIDLATGKKKDDIATKAKYANAVANCVSTLRQMASPFLLYATEESKGEFGVTDTLTDTFWGFHPSVVKSFPELGQLLGINTDLQRDKGYKKGELFCYHSVYGISTKYIPKFNEMNNGMYYRSYRTIVDKMVRLDDGSGVNEHALVQTPHLDKTWHKILPYVTVDKQKQVDSEFYRAFLLAIAYGKITLNAKGAFQIERKTVSSRGVVTKTSVVLRNKGKMISATDIAKLMETLRNDGAFAVDVTKEVLDIFEYEKMDMDTYVGTKAYKGITTSNEDLNAVTIICRYDAMRGSKTGVKTGLISALEEIIGELVDSYNMDREPEQIAEAKLSLLKRVYDSSARVDGKAVAFKSWVDDFTAMGLMSDAKAVRAASTTKKSTTKKSTTKKSTGKKNTKKD